MPIAKQAHQSAAGHRYASGSAYLDRDDRHDSLAGIVERNSIILIDIIERIY